MPAKEFIESRKEMEEILQEETTGYLGLSQKDKPYVVPMNYVYMDGKILFHCALSGLKLDHIRHNPQVCFTVGRLVGDESIKRHEPKCHMKYDSVICLGVARILEDIEERKKLLNIFNRHYQPDAEEIDHESAAQCYAVEIKIKEMTGLQARGKDSKYWTYQFSEQPQET